MANYTSQYCPPRHEFITYIKGKQLESAIRGKINYICYKEYPPIETEPQIPLSFNLETNQLEQNGIYLRFRLKDDFFSDWSTLYVPPEFISIETYTNGSTGASDSIVTIDYEKVLPNGEYIVEYDSYYNMEYTNE